MISKFLFLFFRRREAFTSCQATHSCVSDSASFLCGALSLSFFVGIVFNCLCMCLCLELYSYLFCVSCKFGPGCFLNKQRVFAALYLF